MLSCLKLSPPVLVYALWTQPLLSFSREADLATQLPHELCDEEAVLTRQQDESIECHQNEVFNRQPENEPPKPAPKKAPWPETHRQDWAVWPLVPALQQLATRLRLDGRQEESLEVFQRAEAVAPRFGRRRAARLFVWAPQGCQRVSPHFCDANPPLYEQNSLKPFVLYYRSGHPPQPWTSFLSWFFRETQKENWSPIWGFQLFRSSCFCPIV